MSVGHYLDLDNDPRGLLAQAAQRWPEWSTRWPLVDTVEELCDLRAWLHTADPQDANEALRALVAIAVSEEPDAVVATMAVAWLLLPGATVLANRLATLTPQIDELVAAQLWIEIRTYAWDRAGRVAAGILMNTRAGVLTECGVPTQVERTDKMWSRTSCLDPVSLGALGASATHPGVRTWTGPDNAQSEPAERAPEDEALALLDWARRHDVISAAERTLLLHLLRAAARRPTARMGRGSGGLLARSTSELVADELGIGQATVRRHARRAIRHLAESSSGWQLTA